MASQVFTCPLSSAEFDTEAECAQGCSESRTCTQTTTSVYASGTASFSGCHLNYAISRLETSGSTMTIYRMCYGEDYYEAVAGSLNLSQGSWSGTADFQDGGNSISRVAASGNRITFYTHAGSEQEAGHVDLTGATVTGSADFAACSAEDRISRITASGTKITFYRMCGYGGDDYEQEAGSISLSGVTSWSCPMGSYPCEGTPATCSRTSACETQGCPNGYSSQQSVCVAAAFCASGGVFDPSQDRCEAVPQ